MKVNDTIELTVEKLVYQGYGLCRYDNNFVVFIENALPEEKIKAKITSINRKFARAQIVEIIKPSPNRVKPFCALYNACGSCQMQVCDYDYLVEQKKNILCDIFNIENIKFEKSPVTMGYRHKIQYPCAETKNSKRVLMGYYKKNSHELTNIKFCPIQPELMNELAQYIRDNFKFGCYDEKTHTGLLRHVLVRFSRKSEPLITFVLNSDTIPNGFEDFCLEFIGQFLSIKGIFVNFNTQKGNKILGKKTQKILGDDYILEQLGDKQYKIGPVSFFQVNPLAAIKLFDIVKENVSQNSTILDAYGGVGAIGIWLSNLAKSITLVEENNEAVRLAKENYELNEIKNYEIFEGDAKVYFEEFKKHSKTFDYTILDPPRQGCEQSALKDICEISNNIIYVSCNPATLKRDMEIIKNCGFEFKTLRGIDLFPYTYHIEAIAVFERVKR